MMSSEGYGHRYLIFILCLFIFVMWGLNLFSLSSMLPPHLKQEIKADKEQQHSQNVTLHSVVYCLVKALDLPHITSGNLPTQGPGLLVVVDPNAGLPGNAVESLQRWLISGGNLLLFVPSEHPILNSLGLQLLDMPGNKAEVCAWKAPWLDGITYLSYSRALLKSDKFNNGLFPFGKSGREGQCFVGTVGAGQVCVLSNPDFLTLDGLKKSDNAVFLTRLFEHLLGQSGRLVFFDPYLNAMALLSGPRQNPRPAPSPKKPPESVEILSFWSIIKANPISWTLVQVALALLLYFHGIGKRLGRPLTAANPQDNIPTSLVEGMSNFLGGKEKYAYLADRILQTFYLDLRRKFAVPTIASKEEYLAKIESFLPEAVPQLTSHLDVLKAAAHGRKESLIAILSAVRVLEQTRKDLKLNG